MDTGAEGVTSAAVGAQSDGPSAGETRTKASTTW